MPALRLNGWTIPIAKATLTPREIGTMQRAYNGKQRRTRVAVKQEWNFETPPLPYEDAQALEGMLLGRGEYFPYDTDVYSSKGLWPTSNSNGATIGTTVRAGVGSLFSGGPATNLLTSNQATGTDTSSATTGFSLCDWSVGYLNTVAGTTPAGTLTSYSGSTPAALQGSRSVRAILGSAPSLNFYGVRTDAVAVSASTTYTFSVYMRGYNGTGAIGNLYAIANGNHQLATSTNITVLSGSWVRGSLTFTTRSDTDHVELRFIENTDSQYQLVLDQWMLQLGSAATSWVDGAFAGLSLNYDVSRHTAQQCQAVTFSCWSNGATGGTLMGLSNSSNANCRLTVGWNDSTHLIVQGTDESGNAYSSGAITVTTHTWDMITLVVRPAPASGSIAYLYQNGTLLSSLTPTYLPVLTGLDRLHVGNYKGASQTSGSIDEAWFTPYAMSANMVAALNSLSSTQAGQQPLLLCSGDFAPGTQTRQVLAHDVSDTIVGVGGSSGWLTNDCRVKFSVTEQ